MQWIDPIFETLLSTESFSDELPMSEWVNEIYYGKYHDPLFRFANHYQTACYIGLFFFVIFLPKYKKDSSLYLPLITLVGGFLFSAIWEAQCRYVLPYYLFMLVYVPVGLCNLCDIISYLLQKLLSSRKKSPSDASYEQSNSIAS